MSAEDKTYLELSEEGDGAHKFYEVTVKGKAVAIRFGRIGDAGQTTKTTYPSPDKAKAEAQKKVNEKLRKGYAPAVMGQRQKRTVTRRSVQSRPSTAKQAPVLWKFATGSPALGIFIDDNRCWVGNQRGQVYALGHDAKVQLHYQLPDGVKCIVADEVWIYAGCDDGNVYELNQSVPRLAYEIDPGVNIFWLDIWDGILCVSDDASSVSLFDPEGEKMWARRSKGDDGWMVRCDGRRVYHGHGDGVTAYDLKTGAQAWHQKKPGFVLFGWQTEDAVYPGSGQDDKVYRLDKKAGQVLATYACDDGVVSCATVPGGKYVFAGDFSSSVYCFDAGGKRLWKLATGCDAALSMQYFKDRVYIVTWDGSLACLDATEAAIKAAQAGTVPTARQIKAPAKKGATVSAAVEATADVGRGVVVECVDEGGRLRIRPVSAGYHADWNVQFPRDVREPGTRYVVEGLRESARGGYYRAVGEIRRLTAGPRVRRSAGATTRKKR